MNFRQLLLFLLPVVLLTSFGRRKQGATFDPGTQVLRATGRKYLASIYAYQVIDFSSHPHVIRNLMDTTFREPVRETNLSVLVSRIDTSRALRLDIRTIVKVTWLTSSQPPCKYLEERYTIRLSTEELKRTDVLRLHYTNWQEDEYYSCDSIMRRWHK